MSHSASNLIKDLSGHHLHLDESGQIVSNISGQTVMSSVSGNIIEMSGGQVISNLAAFARVQSSWQSITSISGGEVLNGDADCLTVHIKAMPTNQSGIYLSDSTEPPRLSPSMKGYPLMPGQEITLNIANPNVIYAIANISGDKVTTLSEKRF